MLEFTLDTGHKLYVGNIPNHGVIKAPFGCAKVILSEDEENYYIVEQLPGLFTIKECREWLLKESE